MKILLCHNTYQQPGGEDLSFAGEAEMLTRNGHEVVRYVLHNDAIKKMRAWTTATRTFWNRRTYAALRDIVRRERPAVMHCTNTFPLVSPAAYYAAGREGVAVVQSLRNYRLLCPGACFLRDNRVCEDCLSKVVPWPSVWHGCYRNQRSATAVVAAMLTFHRVLGTWKHAVDAYYTLTEFARAKFIEGGLPLEKLHVKQNFIHPDPGPGTGEGGYVLFVGRLAPEKGIATLLAAWRHVGGDTRLRIIGDGPLASIVQAAVRRDRDIEWLGWQKGDEVSRRMGNAALTVLPSLWYEGAPRTLLESFARGTPVVASRLGAMAEAVDDGRTGKLFDVADAEALGRTISRLLSEPDELAAMRRAPRGEYLSRYTAEENYAALMNIYEHALASARHRGGDAGRSNTAHCDVGQGGANGHTGAAADQTFSRAETERAKGPVSAGGPV